jgi:hypothetical protein
VALGTGLLGLVFAQVDAVRSWRPTQLIVVLGVFTMVGGPIGW